MKKVIFVLLFCLCFFTSSVSAQESSIQYRRINGIYYNQKINGKWDSHHANIFQMNDRVAYCIEPGVPIDTKVYDITYDWSSVNLSNETKEYLEKIGYYGYEYPAHQTDRYYIAAQELIWKAILKDIDVVWSTEKDGKGKIIDVSYEKNEILKLVNNHSLVPSFSLEEVRGKVGEKIVLEDKNNVLSNYEIDSSKYHNVKIDGNKLEIVLNKEKVEDEILNLKRKYYDNKPLLVYVKSGSQRLSALRIVNEEMPSIKIINEEIPVIIEVPNTLKSIDEMFLGGLFIGIGMIIRAIKVC